VLILLVYIYIYISIYLSRVGYRRAWDVLIDAMKM